MKFARLWLRLALAALALAGSASAQSTVTARIVLAADRKAGAIHARGAVLWLTPLNREVAARFAPPPQTAVLTQKDKTFIPHLLVIPAGSRVEFPNRDPFFHNVFSLFEGKRFDLGMYEAGSSRMVNFDRPGVSYIFCNIHPQMSAVVIALATPFFAEADSAGNITIPGVPAGQYQMQVWADGATAEALQSLSRVVSIADGTASLGNLRIEVAALPHKNKYGRDYDAVVTAPYEHP
ncbi:MAG TPA: hypothetical protein VE998_02595 [Terriglobales bacterium]|nr:hypothetical protein [Terriglobales bacterium]